LHDAELLAPIRAAFTVKAAVTLVEYDAAALGATRVGGQARLFLRRSRRD
jgi:hypothetical protein